ncbi:MAG TPA: hypothetical protein VEF90_16840 [Xanthobacteraceae bacterium]|nr:hypothetical protein [Xanthobacteraceae bacterium]
MLTTGSQGCPEVSSLSVIGYGSFGFCGFVSGVMLHLATGGLMGPDPLDVWADADKPNRPMTEHTVATPMASERLAHMSILLLATRRKKRRAARTACAGLRRPIRPMRRTADRAANVQSNNDWHWSCRRSAINSIATHP